MKACIRCGLEKPIDLFHKDGKRPDGHRRDCKTCRNTRSAAKAAENSRYSRLWNLQHPARVHNNYLRWKYGIGPVEYEAMLVAQNGVCAICKQPEHRNGTKYLCVDHSHVTGNIRGLLCHLCNSGIGKLNDDPNLLRAAASYLESA